MTNDNWDYNLHIEAGLVKWTVNDDNEQEWIGTDKQWSKYEELKDNLQN